jgi:hypothetical protein
MFETWQAASQAGRTTTVAPTDGKAEYPVDAKKARCQPGRQMPTRPPRRAIAATGRVGSKPTTKLLPYIKDGWF